jgi:hypothetical protein
MFIKLVLVAWACILFKVLPTITSEYGRINLRAWQWQHQLSAAPEKFANKYCSNHWPKQEKLVLCRLQVSGRHREKQTDLCFMEHSEIMRVKRYYNLKVDCEVDLVITKIKLKSLVFKTRA